ncbi:MAG: YbgC/FadM family acyl-CoA thioesterase [Burkholderiales bacterium]
MAPAGRCSEAPRAVIDARNFSWPVTVYYEDTDAAGVVYHANYLRCMERARTEWLFAMGFDHAALLRHDMLFIVRSVAVEYLKPARLHDRLETTVEVAKSGRCFLVFAQQLLRGSQILTNATVKVVAVTTGSGGDPLKPVAMPYILRRKLENFS